MFRVRPHSKEYSVAQTGLNGLTGADGEHEVEYKEDRHSRKRWKKVNIIKMHFRKFSRN